METRYLREMNCHYLVMKISEKSAGDYQVPMILKNRIPGLLPVHMQMIDGVVELYYEVTSFQSLSGCFESEKLTLEDISRIMLHMNHILEETGKYLLRGTGIVFDPEYVFIDAERQKLEFCYDPSAGDSAAEGLMKMSRFILDHIDYEDKGSVKLAYSLFQECMKENVSVQDFTKLVLEQRNEAIAMDRESFEAESDIEWIDDSEAEESGIANAGNVQSEGNEEHDADALFNRKMRKIKKVRSSEFQNTFGRILLGEVAAFLFASSMWGIWILQKKLSLNHNQLTAAGLICLAVAAALIIGLEYLFERRWNRKNMLKAESGDDGENITKEDMENEKAEI